MTTDDRSDPNLDADPVAAEQDSPGDAATAQAEAAEAEAAAVEAQAAAARARAVRLRRQAEQSRGHSADTAELSADEPPAVTTRRRRLRRPTRRTTAVSGVAVLLCVSLALAGFFAWTDHRASQQRQRRAEFAQAARQDVMALLSLDFNKSKEDMQRISDNSTGAFKKHFPVVAVQLTDGLQRSKATTTAHVNDVAVESMTDNSAVVLVAATTEAKGSDEPQPPDSEPQRQMWQIVLTLLRDNGQPKMSNVEFVQ
jgi:Mce-associated membrane protein